MAKVAPIDDEATLALAPTDDATLALATDDDAVLAIATDEDAALAIATDEARDELRLATYEDEAPAPAVPEAEAPACFSEACAPAPGPAPAAEPTLAEKIEELRMKWQAWKARAADNAVNRWYKKCQKHGAFILLNPPNQARCLSARAFKLSKQRWSPSSERIFKYLYLAPCEVDVLYSLFRTADADSSNTLAVGELMEFLDLKHSDFANRVFCMLASAWKSARWRGDNLTHAGSSTCAAGTSRGVATSRLM